MLALELLICLDNCLFDLDPPLLLILELLDCTISGICVATAMAAITRIAPNANGGPGIT